MPRLTSHWNYALHIHPHSTEQRIWFVSLLQWVSIASESWSLNVKTRHSISVPLRTLSLFLTPTTPWKSPIGTLHCGCPSFSYVLPHKAPAFPIGVILLPCSLPSSPTPTPATFCLQPASCFLPPTPQPTVLSLALLPTRFHSGI